MGKRKTNKKSKIDAHKEDSLKEAVRTKKCSKCGEVKEISEFNKNKYTKDGLRCQCRDCGKEYYEANKEQIIERSKEYYEDNKEQIKERSKKYQENNKEKRKEYIEEYRKNNKEKIAKTQKRYDEDNKEHIQQKSKEYYEDNKEHIQQRHREYYEDNKEQIKEQSKEYCKNNKEKRNKYYRDRCVSDPAFRLRHNFSCLVWQALKANGTSKRGISCMSFLSYTIEQLKDHLESLFTEGMTWENYGKNGWHLDHIIPQSFFIFVSADDVEFRYCWSLFNLQPLWEKDNREKDNKLMPKHLKRQSQIWEQHLAAVH